MKGKLSGRSAATAAAVVVGALLGAIWSRAQSVSPIRFEEPSEMLARTTVGNGQRIDGELFTATAPGDPETPVPTSTIADLCGDGDGCTLRLIFNCDGVDGDDILHKMSPFATDATGRRWWFDRDGFLAKGSLTDGSFDFIFKSNFDQCDAFSVCHFRELAPPPLSIIETYALRANHDGGESVDCTLRIDD